MRWRELIAGLSSAARLDRLQRTTTGRGSHPAPGAHGFMVKVHRGASVVDHCSLSPSALGSLGQMGCGRRSAAAAQGCQGAAVWPYRPAYLARPRRRGDRMRRRSGGSWFVLIANDDQSTATGALGCRPTDPRRVPGGPLGLPGSGAAYCTTNTSRDGRRLVMGEMTQDAF
jgi:hypothetical protein